MDRLGLEPRISPYLFPRSFAQNSYPNGLVHSKGYERCLWARSTLEPLDLFDLFRRLFVIHRYAVRRKWAAGVNVWQIFGSELDGSCDG
jgi:hypothetical protein